MAFLIPAVIALVCDGAVLSLHRMGRHQDDHDESNPDSTTTQGTQTSKKKQRTVVKRSHASATKQTNSMRTHLMLCVYF